MPPREQVLYGARQALGNEDEHSLRQPQTRDRRVIRDYWMTVGNGAVLAALRLLTRLLHREALHPVLFKIVAVLNAIPPVLFAEIVSRHFIDALYLLISENTLGFVKQPEHWDLLLTLAHKAGRCGAGGGARRVGGGDVVEGRGGGDSPGEY